MSDKCEWKYNGIDEIDNLCEYDTGCDSRFYLGFRLICAECEDYKYCPYCGKEIEEVKDNE